MSRLALRAFSKVNLALSLRGLRPDGYHELRTLFQTIAWGDELELEAAGSLELEVVGRAPSGPENLVWRAAETLARGAGRRAQARIRLVKRVPQGSGLGGGSADAAAALVGLDRLWGTRAAPEDLHRMAAGLGSDVPFFLLGGTALGLGRGEELFALPDLPAHAVVVVTSARELATAAVYREAKARLTGQSASGHNWNFARLWRWDPAAVGELRNDLEEAAFGLLPELARVKGRLSDLGAGLALLSGSGSAVYGLFGDPDRAARALSALAAEGLSGIVSETVARSTFAESRFVSGQQHSSTAKEEQPWTSPT